MDWMPGFAHPLLEPDDADTTTALAGLPLAAWLGNGITRRTLLWRAFFEGGGVRRCKRMEAGSADLEIAGEDPESRVSTRRPHPRTAGVDVVLDMGASAALYAWRDACAALRAATK